LTPAAVVHLRRLRGVLAQVSPWAATQLEAAVRRHIEQADTPAKLRDIAQPLRATLTGATVSPPIFEVMQTLGRDETLARLDYILETKDTIPATALPA
jgi:glutamyl-tRNA synthetase